LLQLLAIALTICYCVFHFHNGPDAEGLLDIASEENFDTYKDLWKTATYYQRALVFEVILLVIL